MISFRIEAGADPRQWRSSRSGIATSVEQIIARVLPLVKGLRAAFVKGLRDACYCSDVKSHKVMNGRPAVRSAPGQTVTGSLHTLAAVLLGRASSWPWPLGQPVHALDRPVGLGRVRPLVVRRLRLWRLSSFSRQPGKRTAPRPVAGRCVCSGGCARVSFCWRLRRNGLAVRKNSEARVRGASSAGRLGAHVQLDLKRDTALQFRMLPGSRRPAFGHRSRRNIGTGLWGSRKYSSLDITIHSGYSDTNRLYCRRIGVA